MNKNSNSKMMKVYVLEQDLTYDRPCITMGLRTIPKDDFLHQAYDIIGCCLVDVREFEYKGKYFDAWFDEEFLCSGKPLVPTLLLGELKKDAFDLICGSIIIAHLDEEGATCGITIEEANELSSFMYENFLKINKASIMGLFGKKST